MRRKRREFAGGHARARAAGQPRSPPPPPPPPHFSPTRALAISPSTSTGYPYPTVLRLALDFYHAQRSGPSIGGPNDTYAVPWRGPSVPTDPFPAHFDAGDGLLLMFPYGQTLSLLGWAFLPEIFRAGFEASPGAADSLRSTLRVGAEAVMAAHSAPKRYAVQIGQEQTDHNYWGRPEDMAPGGRGLPRPVLEIDAAKGIFGSDAAGQGVAALAAAAVAWKDTDPSFAAAATSAARSLYGLATTHEGRFSDRLPIGNMCEFDGENGEWRWRESAPNHPLSSKRARSLFPLSIRPRHPLSIHLPRHPLSSIPVPPHLDPSSSYLDDLTWAAAWMARLTGEAWYLERASFYWDRMTREEPRSILSREQSWSCSTPAAAVLLAGLSGDAKYASFAYLFVETHVQGAAPVAYTPAGLAYRNPWGSLRNAANPALVAAVYGSLLRRWGGEGSAGEDAGKGASAGAGVSVFATARAGVGKIATVATAKAKAAPAAAAAATAKKPVAAPTKPATPTAPKQAVHAANSTLIPAAATPPSGAPAARLGRLYQCWARGQARYALGDTGRSFVVGWGVNPPTHVHHRAASCPTETGGAGSNSPSCGKAQFDTASPNPQVHAGALAGGPNALDRYTDVRTDYVGNEVALGKWDGREKRVAAVGARARVHERSRFTHAHSSHFSDYNAAFSGVLAMLR